jgi:hypothetical protein
MALPPPKRVELGHCTRFWGRNNYPQWSGTRPAHPPVGPTGGGAAEPRRAMEQKQLPIQKLANVRTCLALATFTVQVAMIANSIWGLPLRNISTMAAAFT